jgi:hypothetical protein
MSTSSKINKQTFASECSALITGVTAMTDKSFLMGGGTVAKADALQPMQDYVDAEEEVTTTDAAYRAAVAKAHAAEVPALAMVADLKPYLRARLGKTNPALKSQFGIDPIQPPTTKVATKAAGVAKASATRKAKKAAASVTEPAATPGSKPTT